MYFFFHLLTGLILGFLLSDLLRDTRWLIPCAVGAVLPDLIDKTIGHLLFPASIGYGRIYSHTLMVTLLIFGVGIWIWRTRRDPGVFALGTGILSHQVLDLMWRQPADWYYPFMGPFHGKLSEDYFWVLIVQELRNPFELILGFIVCIGLMALIFHTKMPGILTRNRHLIAVIAAGSALMFCIVSGIVIGAGITGRTLKDPGWSRPEELILAGAVMALAAWLVWRWQARLARG